LMCVQFPPVQSRQHPSHTQTPTGEWEKEETQ
jgi:hypothetical protein